MSAPGLPGPDAVHRFWFGDVDDWAECARRNNARWFHEGRALDAPVRERFLELVTAAGDGVLDGWLETPRGAMALILALDQFPRHIHRGSAAAFALDGAARRACEAGIGRGHDAALSPVECSFFYLPLEHAEDIAAQERCVSLMEAAARRAEPELGPYMAEAVRYARAHRDIVARFGRFPHRNAVLGRVASAAETDFLQRGGARFGQ